MNAMKRSIELKRRNRDAATLGASLMTGTVMAVCTGAWVIDGACDPTHACESMQDALLRRDYDRVAMLNDHLAEGIFRAHRAGDFTPANDDDIAFIAKAEAIVDAHYDSELDLASLAI
jgi:hypothetical protein